MADDVATNDIRTMTCPVCGTTIAVDDGHVIWCRVCEWNVDPGAPPAPATRRGRRAATRAEAAAARAYARAVGSRRETRTDRLIDVFPILIALAVHGVSLLLVVGGVVLIVSKGFLGVIFGLLFISIGILLQPRLGRVPKGATRLRRDTAPILFGLLDEITDAVHGRSIDVVLLNGDFNASYATLGWWRRRVLTLGIPYWLALPPQPRVGLLAHEIAHQVNGDSRRGLLVGSSIETLAAWRDGLGAGALWGMPYGGLIDLLTRAVMWPVVAAVRLLLRTQLRLTLRRSRAAEYEADRIAAEVASADAVLESTELALLAESCMRTLAHEGRHGSGELWARIVRWRREFPEGEFERLRRVARHRPVPVDSTHPPTTHRAAVVAARGAAPAVVVLDTDRSRRIDDEEILPASKAVERSLREQLKASVTI
jgi:Zn-dependent protease with chaperone function